jgi:hypothetical protein
LTSFLIVGVHESGKSKKRHGALRRRDGHHASNRWRVIRSECVTAANTKEVAGVSKRN